MLYAGKVMAASAIDVMREQEKLEKAKQGYISPIGDGAELGTVIYKLTT
ncbi:hypothetical protein ABID56_001577 [Alkalibacillus flavidus]|uniref:Uncharacterized protein n=1 Tax=Alkalibacillus flavidus TaxID=546021 RepID=A0ABV2KV64_9BACI